MTSYFRDCGNTLFPIWWWFLPDEPASHSRKVELASSLELGLWRSQSQDAQRKKHRRDKELCREQGRQSEGYARSSCSSLRCRWWAHHTRHLRAAPRVQALHQNQDWERTSLLEAGRPCYCPYSLGAPGAQCRKCLRGISSRIFPGAPSEGEGIQTSGPGLALAARLPHTPPLPLPVCSTPDKYLLCCGTQAWAGSHGGM